ncbi:MAG TPA: CorA family divalent cation transporter, partial [Oxalicibacterium sp.]|nr:CorA family divalent cation transporter [Oxalicibacterium sp.]
MSAAALRYGSDQSGLIWGFLFGQEQAAVAIDADAAAAWLQEPDSAGNEFLWLHFNLSNTASEKWMREHANVDEAFSQALHDGSRSTRIELADNALISVVNDVLHDFTLDSADIATLWLQVSRRMMISARRTPLKSIERLRQAVA